MHQALRQVQVLDLGGPVMSGKPLCEHSCGGRQLRPGGQGKQQQGSVRAVCELVLAGWLRSRSHGRREHRQFLPCKMKLPQAPVTVVLGPF